MHMSGNVVVATSLTLAYGSKVAMKASSFVIPRGSVTALIGPNGAGKSTVLNAISGLLKPAGGELSVSAKSDRISYVLQTTKVNETLPISVAEVVYMGRYAGTGSYRRLREPDRAAVTEAMRRTNITDLAGQQLHNLSGGQRQRVFVAQGLAQDHDILLLDEPLTGIDLPAAQAIDAVIHEETKRGCTVIMSTHDLSEAQLADHVLLLSGQVVAAGPPSEVLTSDNLVDAYGAALLHVEDGRVFIDDPAHTPVPGRHAHRDRTIHTEQSPAEFHGDHE